MVLIVPLKTEILTPEIVTSKMMLLKRPISSQRGVVRGSMMTC